MAAPILRPSPGRVGSHYVCGLVYGRHGGQGLSSLRDRWSLGVEPRARPEASRGWGPRSVLREDQGYVSEGFRDVMSVRSPEGEGSWVGR